MANPHARLRQVPHQHDVEQRARAGPAPRGHARRLGAVAALAVLALLTVGLATTTPAGAQESAPAGYLDAVTANDGRVNARGWAADPDAPASIVLVDLYVDGDYADTTLTGRPRPDVPAAFPVYGALTGFDTSFDVAPGRHEVCAYVIRDERPNLALGCATVDVAAEPRLPSGYLDTVTVADDGRVRVAGWAGDARNPSRDVSVDIEVDGDHAHTIATDIARPDVPAVFPAYGGATGFDVMFRVPSGEHRVCAFAVDADGLDARLGCMMVTVAATDPRQPVGHLDVLVPVGGTSVRAAGWAADPSSPLRDVKVDLYVDGGYVATTTATGARPDVAAAFPALGSQTGFDLTANLSAGSHRVCLFAIDQETLNTRLGCRTVTVGS